MRFHERTRCEYCMYGEEDCRAIQLRDRGWAHTAWGASILACAECREYMRGYFRYTRFDSPIPEEDAHINLFPLERFDLRDVT